jgi:hypothetical protein
MGITITITTTTTTRHTEDQRPALWG